MRNVQRHDEIRTEANSIRCCQGPRRSLFLFRQELRGWLSEHVNQANGIWAIFYKKSTVVSDLSWEAIVEECLCFGWIDSLPGNVDATKTKIYFSTRKKSSWSQRNKALLVA